MARKKEPSVKDSLEVFQSVIDRIGGPKLIYQNRNILITSSKGINIGIIVDQTLWNEIWKDNLLAFRMTEFNINDPDANNLKERFSFLEEYKEEEFLPLDQVDLYNGKVIEIHHDEAAFDIMINKNLFPLRFKKAEFNNFGYQIKKRNYLALSIKKTFVNKIPDTNFTIMRNFKVL